MQFSQKMYGFRQKEAKQDLLEKFLIFTIYQNYTLALNRASIMLSTVLRVASIDSHTMTYLCSVIYSK